ncbi:MAG: SCO family protein [Gammaproteobacteria bacterium]|nr:MAG: SCO family protein [Gammaproteobacteria bacterium]
MSQQMKKMAMGIGLGMIFGVLAMFLSRQFMQPSVPDAYQRTGGDFTLQSPQGRFNLHDWRDKVVLLYFGYTHCPDKCPLTLQRWAQVFRQLPQDKTDHVGGLLITVDPERDTLPVLQDYTRRFHPNIMGLTGSEQEIRRVADLYRADFEAERHHLEMAHEHQGMTRQASGNGTVEHSSFVYVIGRDGRVHAMLPFDAPIEKLRSSIERLL